MLKILSILILLSPLWGIDIDGAKEVNRIRKLCGMSPLKNNAHLATSAYHHAKYLARNRLKGHTENSKRAFYFGKTPFDRFIKAGYPCRIGLENVSYGNKSYKESIRVLMSTLYHRLAFLDFRIDTIGSSEYGNKRGRVYVYDMSNSKVAKLCLNPKAKMKSSKYIYGVCAKKSLHIPKRDFDRALKLTEQKSNDIILYPYPNMKDAPTKYIKETPNAFRGIYKAGVPITAQFNPSIYGYVKLKSFNIYTKQGKKLKSKLLTPSKDRYKKLPQNTFAILPLKELKRDTTYIVVLSALADSEPFLKRWRFKTVK